MVGYSFQRIFVEDIRSGAKRQTIRAPRKRHAREGERLQLFCGMRQPGCFRIIDDPLCVGLDEVRIDLRGLDNITGSRRRDGLIVVNGIPLIGDAAEHYARGDGFRAFDAIESIGHPARQAERRMSASLTEVITTYHGSDGERTKALYTRLSEMGPSGLVAVELFRAEKASQRAKAYRGGIRGHGSYKRMAYDRKEWALGRLCNALIEHTTVPVFGWGWGVDEDQPVHRHVLYVELPTGQVSFHASMRGDGPDYPGIWDGVRGQSADRILRWCGRVLEQGPQP